MTKKRAGRMGSVLRVSLMLLVLGAYSGASAGIIAPNPDQSTDLTAFGFGVVPPIMTLQASIFEQGCVVPMASVACPTGVSDWDTAFTPITGDVAGAGKYSTPTLAELGIDSWFNLAILFNVNEPNNVEAVTLQDLRLGAFDGDGNLVEEFELLAPIDFTNISQGQGSAGFLLRIDAAQVAAAGFSNSWRLGMAAKVGCLESLGECDVAGNYGTGDGPESFTVVYLPGGSDEPIPEPVTMVLFGSGLVLLGVMRFRKRA